MTAREQLLEKVEELRVELLESEKTMDKQEEVLTKQDEEIKDLKTGTIFKVQFSKVF